jgi:hypothetical protein
VVSASATGTAAGGESIYPVMQARRADVSRKGSLDTGAGNAKVEVLVSASDSIVVPPAASADPVSQALKDRFRTRRPCAPRRSAAMATTSGFPGCHANCSQ